MPETKKKLQLVGRIKNMPNGNKEKFAEYQKIYEDQGYEVFNPHDLSVKYPDMPEAEYMGLDLQNISKSDVVAVLPDWDNSKGAKMEVFFALSYGVKVINAKDGKPICYKSCTLSITSDKETAECKFGCKKIEIDVYLGLTKKQKNNGDD